MSLRNAELSIIIFNDLANSSISKLSDDYEKFILTDLIHYKSKRLMFFIKAKDYYFLWEGGKYFKTFSQLWYFNISTYLNLS